jgi:hypothetical protein
MYVCRSYIKYVHIRLLSNFYRIVVLNEQHSGSGSGRLETAGSWSGSGFLLVFT